LTNIITNHLDQTLVEFDQILKEKYASVDAIVVGGGGSIFLNSSIIRDVFKIDKSAPIVFADKPLYAAASGMVAMLEDHYNFIQR